MSKSIRRNVFETNSSSTHSICITKRNILDQKQDYIEFSTGEYGWGYDTLNSPYEKASYLYTGILYNRQDDLLDNIKTILDSNNIEYSFEEPKYNIYEGEKYLDDGYIDHCDELDEILENICKDENKLMKFLFSSESFILTGNDNSGDGVDINVNYEYEEYYKGN